MNDVSLNPEIVELEAEMEYEMPQYPVIPNPEGEPTAEITKMGIDDVIYEVADAEARATLPTKVDKVEGKGLSTNDYTDTDKAIVDGVTSALDGKVDKVQGKGLSTNDYDDTAKAIVDGVTSALELKADKSDTYTKSEVNSALDNKVDKVEGKGLSENDFTDTLKDKLDGIEAEANKTVVDSAISPTSTNPVQNKVIYDLLNDLLPEATETGNPIAITNASGLNAKSLKVELEPIQDLNGYDSPWVGGGGKNKLPLTVDGIKALNTGGTWVDNVFSYRGLTITINQDMAENVTSIKLNGTCNVGTSTINYISFYFCNPLSDVLTEGESYIFTSGNSNGSTSTFCINIPYAGDNAEQLSFTYNNTKHSYARIKIFDGATLNNEIFYPMIRKSTESSEFAPYSNICPISGRTQTTVSVNSEDTTVQLGQTVYGGEVDVTSGATSNTVGFKEFIGAEDENWTKETLIPGINFYINLPDAKTGQAKNTSNIFACNSFSPSTYVGSQKDKVFISNARNFNATIGDTINCQTVEQFKAWLSTHHLQVVYELATPTTINTPSNEISLLKGNNTLTADGDMELKYSKTPQ